MATKKKSSGGPHRPAKPSTGDGRKGCGPHRPAKPSKGGGKK